MSNNSTLGMRWHWWVTHVTALLGTFGHLIRVMATLIASSNGEYDGAAGIFLFDFGIPVTMFILCIIIWCKKNDLDETLWRCCVSVFWMLAGARFVEFFVLAAYGASAEDSFSKFVTYSVLATFNTIYYNRRKSIFFSASQNDITDATQIAEDANTSITKINETPNDKETVISQKREQLMKAEANLQDLKEATEEYKVILKKAFTKDQVQEFVARGQFSEEEARDYEERRSTLETHLFVAPSMIERTEQLIKDLKVELYDLEKS